jgi:UDP-glucuronate 4-epimerase
MDKVLVTGAAGFIGSYTAKEFLHRGYEVVGMDNVNDYYETSLKRDRLKTLEPEPHFSFVEADFADNEAVEKLFRTHRFRFVVHLGAQAGVRYSLENPSAYIQSNLVGFGNILEACRHQAVEHLVYASSSSVYGLNGKMPFSELDAVNHPVSLYAATKKSNELLAHSYSHLFGLPTTGLRFFTVYGPWGRPDMAPMLFAKAISLGNPIKVFNHGNMKRDFTYVDDIVKGVVDSTLHVPSSDTEWDSVAPRADRSSAPYRIFNIGNSEPVQLLYFIECMEKAFGKTVEKIMMPMQPGDVVATFADMSQLEQAIGFRPSTSIEEGVDRFAKWYKDYYR